MDWLFSFPERVLDAFTSHPAVVIFFVLISISLGLLIYALTQYRHNQTSKILKESIGQKKKEIDWNDIANKAFSKKEDKIRITLEQANILMSIQEYKRTMLFCTLGGAGIGFLLFPFASIWKSVFFLIESTFIQEVLGRLFATIVLGYLGSYIPYFSVQKKAKQRTRRLESQIQDSLEFIADGLQSGLILKQAIKQAGEELDYPIGDEFKRVYNEMETGRTFEEAISDMAERVNVNNFTLAVSAMKIQTEAGGELEPLLRNMSVIIRDREELKREIEKTISGAKMTGIILLVAPIAFLIVFTLINKETYMGMITTFNGQAMIAVGVVCYGIATFFITRIIKNTTSDI
ncbi:type II secretion system F family protein [Bacillus bombysepticus]|uniref:type II secretion system F family protein n=1 Tax=Bacillus bombysepticus TaxID=658666 RepID=UPI003017CD53